MARQERSAGIVVFRRGRQAAEPLYLLLDYGRHWDFPKGHLEGDETVELAARRELAEETGITDVELMPGFGVEVTYYFRDRKSRLIRKTVWFGVGQTQLTKVRLSEEHVNFAFLPYAQALERATYATAKGVLREAHPFVANGGLAGNDSLSPRPVSSIDAGALSSEGAAPAGHSSNPAKANSRLNGPAKIAASRIAISKDRSLAITGAKSGAADRIPSGFVAGSSAGQLGDFAVTRGHSVVRFVRRKTAAAAVVHLDAGASAAAVANRYASARADDSAVLDVACAWELLHAFLLAHDDLIDAADIRRDRPSLHRQLQSLDHDSPQFGQSLAIVAGDLLFGSAMRLLAESDLPQGCTASCCSFSRGSVA